MSHAINGTTIRNTSQSSSTMSISISKGPLTDLGIAGATLEATRDALNKSR